MPSGSIHSGNGGSTRKNRDWIAPEGERYHKSGKGPSYPWKSTFIGQRSLCALNFQLLVQVTEDDMNQKTLGELNVSATNITKWLLSVYPEIDEDVRKYTGHGLTVSMVRGRLDNMLRENDTKQLIIGKEYPKRHPVLQHIFPSVSKWLKRECSLPGSLSRMPRHFS